VNNVFFKAVEVKNSTPYVPILPKPEPPSSSVPPSELPKSQAFVDLNKPKPTQAPTQAPSPSLTFDNQWKAPWLNIQRNKQRQVSSDNVVKSYSAVSTQKYHDAASILKHKLDAKILNMQNTTKPATEVSPAKREHFYKPHSGMKLFLS
jgi:hypothetical protein